MTWPKGSGIPAGGDGQGPPSGLPARGYTRPPFVNGNAAHLTHGVRSPRVFLPLARELVEGLLADHPDLAAYPSEVAAWAEWEARAMLMRRHLAAVGDLDDAGEVRPSVTRWLQSCEDRAARARASLGLTPFSEASLAKERAAASVLRVDLVEMLERGRATIAARIAAGEWTEPEDPAGEALAAVAAEGFRVQARAAAEQAERPHGAERREA